MSRVRLSKLRNLHVIKDMRCNSGFDSIRLHYKLSYTVRETSTHKMCFQFIIKLTKRKLMIWNNNFSIKFSNHSTCKERCLFPPNAFVWSKGIITHIVDRIKRISIGVEKLLIT